MKFLSVRDLRSKSAQIWKELPFEKEMIITNNGRPIAIISATDESSFEESLANLRKNRAIDAVNSIQKSSVNKGLNKLSLDEINNEIDLVRKKRH